MRLFIIIFLLVYFLLGAVLHGLMHRYDPAFFDGELSLMMVVCWWPLIIPGYWFLIFCDRCMVWFEKKTDE